MSDDAYLRAVLADPAADGPRLVMADRLDELGECARSEFIRVQIDIARICGGNRNGHPEPDADTLDRLLTRESELMFGVWEDGWCDPLPRDLIGDSVIRRGFLESVTLPTRQFVGRPCVDCHGQPDSHLGRGWPAAPCSECNGTGTIPGCAEALFAAAPLTAVTLSDREPHLTNGRYYWFGPREGFDENPNRLPAELWDLLPVAGYNSREAAQRALSLACVKLGRSLANLPAWEPPPADRPAGQQVGTILGHPVYTFRNDQ